MTKLNYYERTCFITTKSDSAAILDPIKNLAAKKKAEQDNWITVAFSKLSKVNFSASLVGNTLDSVKLKQRISRVARVDTT